MGTSIETFERSVDEVGDFCLAVEEYEKQGSVRLEETNYQA